MKKWIFVLILLLCSVNTYGAEIKYKNIKNGTKINLSDSTQLWSINPCKNSNYLIKEDDIYISKDGSRDYYTNCDYEFINNGKFIGYSNSFLKFYEFNMENDNLKERELTEQEVQNLFPEYKIIKLSEFSDKTHSLKIKKDGNKKIILYNDIDSNFTDYCFTSGNSNFETYKLKGFINVNKGMIQFSSEQNADLPWFVLLIR